VPHDNDYETGGREPGEIATIAAENASLRERLLRALADAENARRRADQTAEDTRKFSIAEFARELLPVLDNLKRTVDASEKAQSAKSNSLVEGVDATLRLFVSTLERFGIRRIEAMGQHFDPNLHEAINAVNDASRPPGTIIQVVEQGYMIHQRLLRPARVVITRRAQAPPPPDNGDLGAEWGSSWLS